MKNTVRRVSLSTAVAFGFGLLSALLPNPVAAQGVVVRTTEASTAAGGTAAISVDIAGTPAGGVATCMSEVSFDAGTLDIDGTCASGNNDGAACTSNADCAGGLCVVSCTKDDRLSRHVGQFSRPAPDRLILFVGDVTFPVNTFDDGPLYSCTFRARNGAASGIYPLTTTFLEVGDNFGDPIAAGVDDGAITVSPADSGLSSSGLTAVSDDGGCTLVAGGGTLGWFHLIPAALLVLLRRRRRVSPEAA